MTPETKAFDLIPEKLVHAHISPFLEQEKEKPLIALIDIDSTVMETSSRNLAILKEAARSDFPELARIVDSLDPVALGWNLTSALAGKMAMDEERKKKLRRFWSDRFFVNDWLEHDTPYPGVITFLEKLQKEGLMLLYLTGRDRPNMAEGTIASFRKHGVPFASEEDFIFKPNPEEDDLSFKVRSLDEAASRGKVLLALENEPANANRMYRSFKDALVFCIDTITTENPEPLDQGIFTFRRYA
jgi:hypothetical protein